MGLVFKIPYVSDYISVLSGVLTAIPWELLSEYVDPLLSRNLDGSPATGVGMLFLPRSAFVKCYFTLLLPFRNQTECLSTISMIESVFQGLI